RVGEVEPLQQLGRTRRGFLGAEVVEPADHVEVLAAGEVLVDRGVLAGKPDDLAYGAGLADDVVPGDQGTARVGSQKRGEDADGGGLAGAVGPQQAEDGAGRHGKVDPGERGDLSVLFG